MLPQTARAHSLGRWQQAEKKIKKKGGNEIVTTIKNEKNRVSLQNNSTLCGRKKKKAPNSRKPNSNWQSA